MGGGLSKDRDQGQVPPYSIQLHIDTGFPVEDVIQLAIKAGDVIMDIYNQEDASWDVVEKADSSPLTRADTEANAVICNELARISPHIPIISEENKQLPYSIRKEYQYFWIVDPLDGTKEFIKRNGQFTVNIALVQGSTPVLGVVHVPALGKTYWAMQGRGAFLREGDKQRSIKAATFRLSQPGLSVVGSASHKTKETQEFLEIFTDPIFKELGSSLKLTLVAEGEAHVYPRLAPTMEWDTAAADIVVREAGGAVLQAGACSSSGEALEDWKEILVQQKPLVYNKENLLNPFFVVFGARLDEIENSS